MSKRVSISWPKRDAVPGDITIHTDNSIISVHRLMLMAYPYFAGLLESITSTTVHLPFDGKIVEKLINLIYGGFWMGHKKARELLKILAYTGIYYDEWFNRLFIDAKYKDACEYLFLYGDPDFIRDGTFKPDIIKEHYDYDSQALKARVWAKYLCCISNEHFFKLSTNLSSDYFILRYICKISKKDLVDAQPIERYINDLMHNLILPNYKCLSGLQCYKKCVRKSYSKRYKKFFVIIRIMEPETDEDIKDPPKASRDSSDSYDSYVAETNCYFGHDDGW